MGSKAKAAGKQASLSSEAESAASSSSEASSSRSASPAPHSSNDVESTSSPASAGDVESGSALDSDNSSDADSESEDESSSRPKIDAAKAQTKLHHVAKTLRATAKKTKTFEVQKLVKKLKGLRKKSSLADQAELAEAELEALKSIDINLLAGRALVTKMVKAKLLPRPTELASATASSSLYLPLVKAEELLGEIVLGDPVVAEGDRALERAKAKVASSKVLADEVGRFVEELKKLAGIEPAVTEKKTKEDKGKGKAVDDDEEADREWSGSESESESETEAIGAGDVDDMEDDEVDEEELERVGKQKLAALGDLSQWDDLIGSDSAAESDENEDEPPKPGKRAARHSDAGSDGSDDDISSEDSGSEDESSASDSDLDSGSDQDSDSDSESKSDSSASGQRSKKRKASTKDKASKKAKTSGSSAFLPSLSTGFIAGRSDDEWSDAEADLADRDLSELKNGKKERKNRMGQRARKALYEKKYGKNANHIKVREQRKAAKQARPTSHAAATSSGRVRPPAFQAPAKRDGGWGGPVAPLPKQPKRPFVPRPAPLAPAPAPAHVQTPQTAQKPAASSQEMHPSWIAKQKQKELMAQVKPEGKKIVFD